MIREIINFVKGLEEDYPEVFELNKKPSLGLHLWVELGEDGNWKNKPPVEGEDYVVYDGKRSIDRILDKAIKYSNYGRTVGGVTDTNKCLDLPAKKIHSCSPFIISYRRKEFENVHERINTYFDKTTSICIEEEDESLKQKVHAFKNNFQKYHDFINSLVVSVIDKKGEEETIPLIDSFKDDSYINIYFKNIELELYRTAHIKYIESKLFNTDRYNYHDKVTNDLYGLSNFLNGANSKKPFLEHKTASIYKGISGRITSSDASVLNRFEVLQACRVLPNPLPIFIDKNEFKTNTEIISVFNIEGERKFSYPQLLKKLYENNDSRILGNYYLLNMSRGVVNDFDFVSNFQYKLEGFDINNLFQLPEKEDLRKTVHVKTIFGFENKVVTRIFNNALVKEKNGEFSYNYYNDIDPNYVSGGELMANAILRFRKAFYDFIYKSHSQSITSNMFDEVMLISIISDIRLDECKEGRHSKEWPIKEKLNIWFSLYNKFSNQSKNRENMAQTFKSLLEKTEKVANDDNVLLEENNVGEFLFAAGQVIYFLLSKSKASNPTHALLEPFLQKSNAVQLQNAIANAVNAYKHEISFYKDRFERLAGQVLAYETKENLKNYQRYLLAGYFAPAVIYK